MQVGGAHESSAISSVLCKGRGTRVARWCDRLVRLATRLAFILFRDGLVGGESGSVWKRGGMRQVVVEVGSGGMLARLGHVPVHHILMEDLVVETGQLGRRDRHVVCGRWRSIQQ